jgi:hypothetical protein
MMGGLIAATILTLTFLPALYALAFRVDGSAKQSAGEASQGQELPRSLPAAA